jgi:hypothetical protein
MLSSTGRREHHAGIVTSDGNRLQSWSRTMPQTVYAPKIHSGLDPQVVLDRLRRDGWDPIPINDPAGHIYPPHSHATTKLLAILFGSMEVRMAGENYQCLPGDQVVIQGGVEHAALVGPNGCQFFWSEQLR